ncbi:hypothetical protein [Pseudomonas serbica]|jgi:hypothetical protein|uniref:hypothetical protein n=1 Tax=Pseudomonas serbica TaxID=2965074 RepID=UPI00237B9B29|nr:hypothetical protein [Pseudomonas serbica]
MSTTLFKKSLQAATDVFDGVAARTFDSYDKASQFVSDYNELTRAQDYTGAKRIFDKLSDIFGKYKFVGDIPFIKDPAAAADWFSETVGSIAVVQQFKNAMKHYKLFSLGTIAGASALNTLAPNLFSDIALLLNNAGIPYYVTALTGVSLLVLAPGMITGSKTLKMKSYADFDPATCEPDFSAKEVSAISEGLKNGRSESKMVSQLSGEQKDTIIGLAKRLREDFFVPEHLATTAVLTMLVEKEGKSEAVKAMFNCRIMSRDLITRFEIDPLSTVGGKPVPDDEFGLRF